MSYRLHPQAAAELEQAAGFYAQHGGNSVAKAFLKEIHRVANLLVANPGFGTPASLGLRAYPLRRFPYSLVYDSMDDSIEILVVAHQHRQPGYWQSRR
jgi:plasmid stabilization system protein ParE